MLARRHCLGKVWPTASFIKSPLFLQSVEEPKKCITSNVSIMNNRGAVMFMCPACGKHEIVRTSHMRKLSAKYTCPECGFEGPN